MAANYQNSLGWLNLQLKAQDLQRQQAKQDAAEIKTRDLQQQDFNNALSLTSAAERAHAAEQARKIQVAGLLQKTADTAAAKAALQDDQQAFKQGEQDAKTDNLVAKTATEKERPALVQEQRRTIGADDARADADLEETKRYHDIQDRNAQQEQRFGLLGKGLAFDPQFGGQNQEFVKAASEAAGVPYAPEEVDPSTYKIPKAERVKASEAVPDARRAVEGIGRARAAIDAVPDQYFGQTAGGIGDKFGAAGKFGVNDIRNAFSGTLLGNLAGVNPEDTEKRRVAEGEMATILNDLNKLKNTARATDADRANIARELGQVNSTSVFSVPKKHWQDLLDLRDRLAQGELERSQEEAATGRRKKVGATPAQTGQASPTEIPLEGPIATPRGNAPGSAPALAPPEATETIRTIARRIRQTDPDSTTAEILLQALEEYKRGQR